MAGNIKLNSATTKVAAMSINFPTSTFYFLLHLPPSTSYLLPSSLSKYQQTRGEVWRGEAFFIKDSTKGSKWPVWDFYVFPIPPCRANLGYIFPLFVLNTGWNVKKKPARSIDVFGSAANEVLELKFAHTSRVLWRKGIFRAGFYWNPILAFFGFLHISGSHIVRNRGNQ